MNILFDKMQTTLRLGGPALLLVLGLVWGERARAQTEGAQQSQEQTSQRQEPPTATGSQDQSTRRRPPSSTAGAQQRPPSQRRPAASSPQQPQPRRPTTTGQQTRRQPARRPASGPAPSSSIPPLKTYSEPELKAMASDIASLSQRLTALNRQTTRRLSRMAPADSIPKRLRYRFEGDYRRTLALAHQHQDHPQDLATIVALADIQRRNFKFKLAESYLQKALALEPLNQAYLFDLGHLYLESGETTKAWSAFQEVIYLNPESIEARLAQGRVREKEGALEGATSIYNRIEAKFGTVAGVYAHRTLNMVERGDFGAAITIARDGLARYPDHAPLYYARGRAHAGLGLWDRAKTDYYDALSLDANLLEAYAALGEVSLAEGNAATAIRAYLRLMDERPGDASAALQLGKAYLMDLRFQEAIEEWELLRYLHPAIEEADPWLAQAYYLYSLELRDAGHYREALEAHQKAMSLTDSPRSDWVVEALNQAGAASRAHDDHPRSLRYYDLALKNDPFDVDSHIGMSRTYRAMRNPTKAVAALQRALAIDPNHPTARIELNRIQQP